MMFERVGKEGQRIVNVRIENRHRLLERLAEPLAHIGDRALRPGHRDLREDRLHPGCKLELTCLGHVCWHVAVEIDLAALPSRARHRP